MEGLDDLLDAVRRRYVELRASEHRQARLLAHLESPSHWEADTQDYPSPDTVPFPKRMRITYAACHPECGPVSSSSMGARKSASVVVRACSGPSVPTTFYSPSSVSHAVSRGLRV